MAVKGKGEADLPRYISGKRKVNTGSTPTRPLQRCRWFIVVLLTLAGWKWLHSTSKGIGPSRSLSHGSVHPNNTLSQWIEKERAFALQRTLENIGPFAGAKDGLVIASPSHKEAEDVPDYFYTWTRDSALTISTLSSLFLLQNCSAAKPKYTGVIGGYDPCHYTALYEPLLRSYVSSQAELQVISNPSGDLFTGGLSEPKFNVDGSAFTGSWGRPQRDGPALRALALIPYANYLLDRGTTMDLEYVEERLYNPRKIRAESSTIKSDLEEVASSWWQEGFDLWEEVNGHHLFTRLVSLRALQQGADIARRLDDPDAEEWYEKQARDIQKTLGKFWVSTLDDAHSGIGFWVATTLKGNSPWSRTGLDCAFPLSIIHAGDRYSMSETAMSSFEPTNPDVLATIYRYILTFDGLYPINTGKKWTEGWALGRYAEDIYDGVAQSHAHPWFICTFAIAHVFYLAYESFGSQGKIEVTKQTLDFWTDILGPSASVATGDVWSYVEGDSVDGKYEIALQSLWEVAERYMEIGMDHTVKGHISEQINRFDGSPHGARDLTWSYASFIDASGARQRA